MSKNNLAEERLEKNSNKNERSRVSEFRHRNTLKPKNAKTEKVKPKKFNQLQKFIFTNIAIENNQKSTEIILQPKSLLRFSFLQSKNSNRS